MVGCRGGLRKIRTSSWLAHEHLPFARLRYALLWSNRQPIPAHLPGSLPNCLNRGPVRPINWSLALSPSLRALDPASDSAHRKHTVSCWVGSDESVEGDDKINNGGSPATTCGLNGHALITDATERCSWKGAGIVRDVQA